MLHRQWAILRRYPEFAKLWSGQTISSFGSAITGLALPLTAVVLLQATPAQMGVLTAVGFLPHLLFGLPAGVWVDRLPRRSIMIVTDLARALLLGSVPALALLGVLGMADLYAVVFLSGVCGLLFEVAATSFTPSLVERRDLMEANGAQALSSSLAGTAGPAVAGALVQVFSAPLVIALDAVSFLVSALFSLRIQADEPARAPRQERRNLWSEIGEGVRALLAEPILRVTVGAAAVGSLAFQVQNAVLVLYLVRQLSLTPTLLGVVFATSGVASLAGALVTGPVSERWGAGPAMVVGTLLLSIAALLIPLASGPLVAAVPVLMAAQTLRGIGLTVFSINQITVRQAIVPDRLLGRVNAGRRFLVFGVIPLGALLGGALGQTLGLRPTLLAGALISTLSFLWALLSPLRTLRAGPAAAGAPAV